MTDREIEGRLARALGAAAPNRLDGLLEKRAERRAGEKVVEFVPPQPKRQRRIWRGVAAGLLLVLSGVLAWHGYAYTPDSVVDIEVNPSVRLAVGRTEKVISCDPLNGDGADIIGDMDLRGTKLDVAVNALIGSMLTQGYIDELRNSVLITVKNSDADQAQRLQEELTASVTGTLEGSAVHAAVLGQSFSDETVVALSGLAEKYGISEGKASLIERITAADPTLVFADLAALSVNDLNLLLSAKRTDTAGMEMTGRASDKAYIGMDRARELALSGYPDAALKELELDYDDGRMVYECELLWGGAEVELELDAVTGELLKEKVEGNIPTTPAPDPAPVPSAGTVPAPEPIPAPTTAPLLSQSPMLTETEAKRLVLAKIPGAVFTKLKLDYDDGEAIYEGEAVLDGMEYEFELDAYSGVFLDWDVEEGDDD